jgi:predicted MPP superfamily phosphohydrolase
LEVLMKLDRFSRRRFLLALGAAFTATSLAAAADAKWMEPVWVKTRQLRIGNDAPTHRFVHFTDLHYKGDRAYAESVVKTINVLSPDFTCFTGDIMEDVQFLPEALEILSGIKSPMFGVPGNHDYGSGARFDEISKCFEATGGAFLVNARQKTADGKINIVGAGCDNPQLIPPPVPGEKNILLLHYPAWTKKLGGQKFDLVLSGHSHGGQVRVPFCGSIIVPYNVDEYDLGLFQTKAGPLYVNPGIGWFYLDVRFNCRPEITVIEV